MLKIFQTRLFKPHFLIFSAGRPSIGCDFLFRRSDRISSFLKLPQEIAVTANSRKYLLFSIFNVFFQTFFYKNCFSCHQREIYQLITTKINLIDARFHWFRFAVKNFDFSVNCEAESDFFGCNFRPCGDDETIRNFYDKFRMILFSAPFLTFGVWIEGQTFWKMMNGNSYSYFID